MGRENDIIHFMENKLEYISEISDQGEGKAYLAKLRKGIGHSPGEVPELMGILLIDMPEEFISEGKGVSKEEWACYTALTLFAMHQQGNDVKKNPMNIDQKGVSIVKRTSIGTAMRNYVLREEDSNTMDRMAFRLQALGTSKDMKELSYHMKSIIQLLKTEEIPLNYPRLAVDVYEYQFQERQADVRLKWGQDFYRDVKHENIKKEESENE